MAKALKIKKNKKMTRNLELENQTSEKNIYNSEKNNQTSGLFQVF